MARPTGPRFKVARRLGVNVFNHPKALNRGIKDHSKASEYGKQLLEKQKLKAYYDLLEKQFQRYIDEALMSSSNPGETLIANLERRLDSIVYRLGFAETLRKARQLVVHGHITVDGHRVDRPSYRVVVGENIALHEKSHQVPSFVESLRSTPVNVDYLEKNPSTLSGRLLRIPDTSEVPIEVNVAKVFEFYSRG